MDLWIKVQNNKKLKQGLVKVNDLFVEVEEDSEDGKWRITQCCDTLGIYKTEKRALEVLDEINVFIETPTKYYCDALPSHNFGNVEPPYYVKTMGIDKVYKMPKE